MANAKSDQQNPSVLNGHLSYRPDIDGLRAFAVCSVLIFHAFPNALPGGFIGVDVFFVISGFLISGIILEKENKKQFSYFDFYARRVLRIFPALVLVLSSVLIAGWFTLLKDEYLRLAKHVIASSFFLENINLVRESGYFDFSSDLKPLLHLWSLAIEEQFYLAWPAVLVFLSRKRRWTFKSIVALFLMSFCLNVCLIQNQPISTFYHIETRLWELLVGTGLAYLSVKNQIAQVIKNFPVDLIGAFLFLSGLVLINQERAFPGWWALLPTVGTALMIAGGPAGWVNRKILSAKPIVAVGLISYPLYLWHWPLLSFLRILSPATGANTLTGEILRFICLLIAFLLATLTYRMVELPIRNSLKKFKTSFDIRNFQRRSGGILIALMLVIVVEAYAVELKDGFSDRFAANRNEFPLQEKFQSKIPPLIACTEPKSKGIEWCLQTDTHLSNVPLDVAVLGDSHATALASGINQYYLPRGRGLVVMGTGDTLGFIDVGTELGGSLSTDGIRNINSAFQAVMGSAIKTVILVNRGPAYFTGKGFGIDDRNLKIRDLKSGHNQDPAQIYIDGLSQTLRVLEDAKKEVIFVYDNPELGFFPDELCRARPVHLLDAGVLNPCAVPYADFLARQQTYREGAAAVLRQHPNVKIFDPAKRLCDQNFCYGILDDKIFYADHNHLSDFGAGWLSQFFEF